MNNTIFQANFALFLFFSGLKRLSFDAGTQARTVHLYPNQVNLISLF
jgi:hypothetical protein